MSNAAVSVSPNLEAFLTNAGVLIVFIGAAVAGIWRGIKEFNSKGGSGDVSRIAAGTILENTTLLMWSESNRNVTEAIEGLCKEMVELRHEIELDRVSRKRR